MDNDYSIQVLPQRQNKVNGMFSPLRKTYEDLESEEDATKHNYTFRIYASNIARVIDLLQQYLQVRNDLCWRKNSVSLYNITW